MSNNGDNKLYTIHLILGRFNSEIRTIELSLTDSIFIFIGIHF